MAEIPLQKTTSPRATHAADDDMSVFLHHLLSSSQASASAASAPQYALTSDAALALAAKRAAGFAPQSSSAAACAAAFTGWDFFSDGKNPPPRLDLPRPALLPPDRDGTSTAESSAVVDSMFRAASGNIPDFTEKKEADGAGESDASAGRRRKAAADTDFDEYDGESEEGGMDAAEEPVKPFPPRSGGKRSRAAEVHNLSEKRRRSRINEKMKALQNLIPNSNKTDKASMLDEAIEYLKQLQLQVQMLSMRNGLSLHPMYLPGTLQPLQVPQMHVALGAGSASLNVNMGIGMQTVSQDSATKSSFLSNQSNPPPHQPMGIPRITSITSSHPAFDLDLTRAHHGSPFQLPSAVEEIYSEVTLQNQLDVSRSAANPSGRSS